MQQQRLGRYVLLEELGSGGQGAVYRAQDSVSGVELALKLQQSAGRESIKRFQQEARVLSVLSHPHMLKVFDHGVLQDGSAYLASELVRGGDLEALVERSGIPDPKLSARILAGIARCLQYMHEHGIVHRDLKPPNVLLEEGTQRPVLVDFGLVKRDASVLALDTLDAMSQLSQTGTIKGTPPYMAPEQVKAGKLEVGPHTDVYGLGATLYYLLTGRAPFSGNSHVAVMRKVTKKKPEPIQGQPKELVKLCMACLEKDADDRPHSAAAVALELERFAGPSEITFSTHTPRWIPGRAGDPSPPSTLRIGPFTLHAELGRGGMGAVYAATHDDGRRVALKVLLGDAGGTSPERFRRESQVLSRLSHPNLVGFVGAGAEPRPWLAMDYVEGRDLGRIQEHGGRLEFEELSRLLGQAAGALAYLHEQGVVHRDVKPDNLLVRAADKTLLVTDLGVARDLDQSRMTEDGAMIGTLACMAPEQIGGDEVGPPADVWGLGVALYRGLCGQKPFVASSPTELIGKVLNTDPISPRALDPNIPEDLALISLACLQRDAERRPSAAALADALAKGEVTPELGISAELRRAVKRRLPRRRRRYGPAFVLMGICAAAALVLLGWVVTQPEGQEEGATAAVDSDAEPSQEPVGDEPPVEEVEDPSMGFLELPPEERLRVAATWLREHGRASVAPSVRRVLVGAKLALGPRAVIHVGERRSKGWVLGDGRVLTTDHRTRTKKGVKVAVDNAMAVWTDERGSWQSVDLGLKRGLNLQRAAFRRADRKGSFLLAGAGGVWLSGSDPRGGVRLEKGLDYALRPTSACSFPDGEHVALGFATGEVSVYKWTELLAAQEKLPEPVASVDAHPTGISDLILVRGDPELLITRGWKREAGVIKRWTFSGGALRSVGSRTISPPPSLLRAHPSKPWYLLATEASYSLLLIDAHTAKTVHAFSGSGFDKAGNKLFEGYAQEPRAHRHRIRDAVFTPDGARIYTVGGQDGDGGDLRSWTCAGEPSEFGEWQAPVERPPGAPDFNFVDLGTDGTLVVGSKVDEERSRIEIWEVGEGPRGGAEPPVDPMPRLEGLEGPAQVQAARAWLEAHPDHPLSTRPRGIVVQAALAREPLLKTPLLPGNVRGFLLPNHRVLTVRYTRDMDQGTRRHLNTGSNHLRVWDFAGGGEGSAQNLTKVKNLDIYAVAFRDRWRAGDFLLAGSGGLLLFSGDLAKPTRLDRGRNYKERILVADGFPDGRHVAFGRANGMVEIHGWGELLAATDNALPEPKAQIDTGSGMDELHVVSDGLTVVTRGKGIRSGELAKWTFRRGTLTAGERQRFTPAPTVMDAHPTRPWLVLARELTHALTVVDAGTFETVHAYAGSGVEAGGDTHRFVGSESQDPRAHQLRIRSVCFDPGGQRLYSIATEGGMGTELRVWSCAGHPRTFGELGGPLRRSAKAPEFNHVDAGPGGQLLMQSKRPTGENKAEITLEVFDLGE